MAAPKNANWQNPKILLTLFLVFLCGATVGMATMALTGHRLVSPSTPMAASNWKEPPKEVSLQRMKKELDLTPAQSEQLETVLDDYFMYYHTLQAQLDEVRASGRSRMLRILNPEQQRRFEQMMQEKQLR